MRRALFVALLVVVGCSDVFGPRPSPLPAGAVRVDSLPNAMYRQLWADVEQCSGRTRDIGEITFYLVPGAVTFLARDGRILSGAYLPHHGIVLAELVADLGPIVAHEMLHAVRRDTGLVHDADFTERCTGVVAAP